MEYHIEREIRLSEKSDYASLYSWFLEEFTKDGKSAGRKLIPWAWNFYFTATEISYRKNIKLEPSEERPHTHNEYIRATLTPSGPRNSFSAFFDVRH
ncbi:MAG: hypothetical protein ABI612_16520 [Betaproteobacteria bacterium]